MEKKITDEESKEMERDAGGKGVEGGKARFKDTSKTAGAKKDVIEIGDED